MADDIIYLQIKTNRSQAALGMTVRHDKERKAKVFLISEPNQLAIAGRKDFFMAKNLTQQ